MPPPTIQSLVQRLLGLFLHSQSFAADARPNIILMMGDDHGGEETGYNGHPT